MAKDAKIGSLIGLILIFIMAFVINGFTRSGGNKNNNLPSTATADNTGDFNTGGYRSTNVSTTEQTESDDPTSNAGGTDSSVSHPASESDEPERIKNGDSNISEPEPEIPSLSEVYYAVCEGDNLAEIAKKFYGHEEGNRRINIIRLFEANRNVLTSPHKLSIGQKLLVPPLKALKTEGRSTGSVFTGSIFETVTSIGRKSLSTPERNVNPGRLYAVQEGDSLWGIADTLLGEGSRYREIRELNSAILKDEDQLTVGMRLRIPTQ